MSQQATEAAGRCNRQIVVTGGPACKDQAQWRPQPQPAAGPPRARGARTRGRAGALCAPPAARQLAAHGHRCARDRRRRGGARDDGRGKCGGAGPGRAARARAAAAVRPGDSGGVERCARAIEPFATRSSTGSRARRPSRCSGSSRSASRSSARRRGAERSSTSARSTASRAGSTCAAGAPARCTPHDCELVQIGGKPAAPKLPFLHVVGRATFRPGAPLAAYFGGGGSNRPPILLADGVVRVRRARRFPTHRSSRARTAGIVPLAPRSIHDWDLASLGTRLDRAQSQLEQRSRHLHGRRRRTDTIASIRATSRVAAQRLLILGGDAAVLLLGFAVLASTRLRARSPRRRGAADLVGRAALRRSCSSPQPKFVVHHRRRERRRLDRGHRSRRAARSASRRARLAASSPTRSSPLRALGIAAPARRRHRARHARRASRRDVPFGGLRITVADVAALGALAAVLLALARGKADATALQAGGGPASCCCSCRASCCSCSRSRPRGCFRLLLRVAGTGRSPRLAARSRRAALACARARRGVAHRRLLRAQRRHRGLRVRLSRNARAGRARAGALRGAGAVRAEEDLESS